MSINTIKLMNLSVILRHLLQQNNLSETELARRTGISQPLINGLLTGKNSNPKISSLVPIAHFFNIKLSQLIGEMPLSGENATSLISSLPILSFHNIYLNDQLTFAIDDFTRHTVTDLYVSQQAFALEINDTEMEPRFAKGTIIIVEPNKEPRNEDFVLAKISLQKIPLFRQYLQTEDKQFLFSLNPYSRLNLIKILPNDKILGVIIQSRKNHLEIN